MWKDWLFRLEREISGKEVVERPYLDWARYAIKRGDKLDAVEHFEKGVIEYPHDVDLLSEFAKLLADDYKNKDRAAKLVRRGLAALEQIEPLDELRVDELERRLRKYDPKQKTLVKIRDDLALATEGLVQRYMGAELHLQAMDISWRMGNDFEVPAMFTYFEEAARRSKKSLAMWRLAYNEESLEGWASIGNDVYTPNSERS